MFWGKKHSTVAIIIIECLIMFFEFNSMGHLYCHIHRWSLGGSGALYSVEVFLQSNS